MSADSAGIIDDEYLKTQHGYIYNAHDECNIASWYPKISELSVPTYILELTIEDIEALVVYGQYFQNCLDDLETDEYNIIDRHFSILNNDQHKWGETLSWLKLNSKPLNVYKRKLKMMQYKLNTYICEFETLKKSKTIAFIPKLSIDMEIPIDSLYSSRRTYECFDQCLKNKHNNNVQKPLLFLQKYYEACWKTMEFDTATEIIELIIRSEYMLNQLNTSHRKLSENGDINCSLLLQMIPYQSVENILQFRMFVSSQHPIAITQYQSFVNYTQQNKQSFILPMSSTKMRKWMEILSGDHDEKTDTLHECIKYVLIKQYEIVKDKLDFKKCKNYCVDFMIIHSIDYKYKIYVVGVNREPLYEYKYGLLDYYADIQSKHVGFMFGKKIPEVSIRLSVESDEQNLTVTGMCINDILSEYVVQYLYLHSWIAPGNIQQLYNVIIWKFNWINKMVSMGCCFVSRCHKIYAKCWKYVHIIGGFGFGEIFYMCCGGLIALWIEYIVNNSSIIGIFLSLLNVLLSDVLLPIMVCIMGIWFVLAIISVCFLLTN
eukprot:316726_1